MATETTPTLWTALLAVQAAAPTLPKDAANPHFKSKFTPLDTIVEVMEPLLAQHGLIWTALPGRDAADQKPVLNYRLIHAPTGESLDGSMPMFLQKEDAQGYGSALTYGRRYAMTAVLNLVADEDDDGNAAARAAQRPANGVTLVTATDVEALMGAAKGLNVGKIKLAFAAVGVSTPEPFDAKLAFRNVPKDKAVKLAERLSGIEREAAKP